MTSLPNRPFTHADLTGLGLTSARLRALERAGVVRRVLHGVYADASLPDDLRIRAQAAALVLPPTAVVCDDSAAWLHGIQSGSAHRPEVPRVLDVASVAGLGASRRDGVFGCKRGLRSDDVMRLHGMRVTTPLRTAADLACRWGRLDAMAVLDEFRRVHGLSLADYAMITTRFAGRRGVTQLRELGPRAITEAESPPESWTRITIVDHGLPEPEPQVDIYVDGYGWVRPDLAYVPLKIAIEYDGVDFHTSPEDREHDKIRRRAMRDAGWIVIVVRKDGFAEPGLSRWIGELRAAYQERRPAPRRRYARAETSGVRRRVRPR